MADELPVHLFAGPGEMGKWLEANHDSSQGIWLKIAKKGASEPSVTYEEAVELALCFGWIDSQVRRFDDQHYLQRFTPRRPRGRWSKADGRWEAAYEGQRTAKVPPDLQRELDANPAACEFFASLSSANRYAIIYRLDDAKKPETRVRRLRKFIAMLERGEKIHG
jgi:uncharacterized protein YdeI (YjbR/CyaY-like superfamily)